MEIVNNDKLVQGISLNKELFPKVRTGKKVASTRLGVKDYSVGNAFFVNPGNEEERVKVVVNTIFLSTFEDILKDKMHSVLEGYDSKREFLDEMYGIYGKIEPQDIMTVIFFSYRQIPVEKPKKEEV